MKLNIRERVSLIKIINASATSFSDRIRLNSLKKEMDFTEKEVEDLQMRDINDGEKMTTTWDPQKAEDMGQKKINLSPERERVLRKAVMDVCKRTGMLVDGLTENVYDELQFNQVDLKYLSLVVDNMDNHEQITELNFPVCQKIKKAVEEKNKAGKKENLKAK